MGRIIGALALFVGSLALWGAPATAEPSGTRAGRPPGQAVTGTFVGTSTYRFSDDPACNFVLENYSGTYTADSPGVPAGTFALDVCIFSGAPAGFGVTGTFEIVSDGMTLLGTVDGVLGGILLPEPGVLSIEMTLAVTGSRGTSPPLRGTIIVTGTRVEPQFMTSNVEGHFTADLRPGRRPPR